MSGIGPVGSLLVGAALIALSAFFVAIEFALVAARRYRLEEAAQTSASARAALRSSRDLSLLLAGSQLGITLCTLGLGAVAKPAVHDLFVPLLEGWGLPAATSDVLAFVLSLLVVTFLHLVVGEMAPKSWAIAHPERSATLLALPMRAFMVVTRPLLVALNGLANRCLRAVGVEPVDEVAAGRNPETLRELVDHSARAGALDRERRDQLLAALELDTAVLRTLVRPAAEISAVDADDTVDRVREVSRESGHLRLLVRRGGDAVGVVHVRDTLAVEPGATAARLMRPVPTLPADVPVHDALSTLRRGRNQFALVEDGDRLLGMVTMQDLLDRLLPDPQLFDETGAR
ncbi:hemolysin family protein [Pseudonocardia humida]|uniref:hemolysin family protein n=1 Tax=Pseudonocardia humida TaxID=2800819 RepID=UPI00207C3D05|nr:hemolysin family protein [Pseudonocardia humida]